MNIEYTPLNLCRRCRRWRDRLTGATLKNTTRGGSNWYCKSCHQDEINERLAVDQIKKEGDKA